MRILLRIVITLASICILSLFVFWTADRRQTQSMPGGVRFAAAIAFAASFLLAIVLSIVTIWVA